MRPSKNIYQLLAGLEGNLEPELRRLAEVNKPDVRLLYDGVRLKKFPYRRRTLLEAIAFFFSRVDIRDENLCWEWNGPITRRGYANFDFPSTGKPLSVLAHRLSFVLFNGSDPRQLLVCHRCDNRKCVSPFHLFLGTDKDNRDDCISKNRMPEFVKGADHPNAILSIDQVMEISKIPMKEESNLKISVRYNVSKSTITDIRNGGTWGHLTGIQRTKGAAGISPPRP